MVHIRQKRATCSERLNVLNARVNESSTFLVFLEQNPQLKNDEWSYIFLCMNDNLFSSSADEVMYLECRFLAYEKSY